MSFRTLKVPQSGRCPWVTAVWASWLEPCRPAEVSQDCSVRTDRILYTVLKSNAPEKLQRWLFVFLTRNLFWLSSVSSRTGCSMMGCFYLPLDSGSQLHFEYERKSSVTNESLIKPFISSIVSVNEQQMHRSAGSRFSCLAGTERSHHRLKL